VSIYTHPKIAAMRQKEAVEREIRLARAILNEAPGTIPKSGRGQRDWALKTIKTCPHPERDMDGCCKVCGMGL
jgi:hypothetical protein